MIRGPIFQSGKGRGAIRTPGLDTQVWIMSYIGGSSRAIAAVVTKGTPNYQLLLGRHWMASVNCQRNYIDGEYTIEDNHGDRVQLVRSDRPRTAEQTELMVKRA